MVFVQEQFNSQPILVDFDEKTSKPFYAGLNMQPSKTSSSYIAAANTDFLTALSQDVKPRKTSDTKLTARRKEALSEWEERERQQKKKRQLIDFV